MKFEFAAPGRIVFGPGSLVEVGPAAASLASANASVGAVAPGVLVVSGRSTSRAAPLFASLEAAGLACERFAIANEPRFEDARAALALARAADCRLVVGFGGARPSTSPRLWPFF